MIMTNKRISEDISKRITSLRFLLAVFVVMIHNYFSKQTIIDASLSGQNFIFNQTLISEWVLLFLSQGICRCGVSLFFMFSAYLQSKNQEKVFNIAKKLAPFSFFLYAIHFFLMICIRPFWIKLFPMKNDFFIFFEYLGCSALIISLGLLIGILLKKYLPPFFFYCKWWKKIKVY